MRIIFYLILTIQSMSLVWADANPENPAKIKKPCGFTDNINCFENGKAADAEMINANFKVLFDEINSLKTTIQNQTTEIQQLQADGNKPIAYVFNEVNTPGSSGPCNTSWTIVPLNTVTDEYIKMGLATQNDDTFTLSSGKYEIDGFVNTYRNKSGIARLINTTNGTDVLLYSDGDYTTTMAGDAVSGGRVLIRGIIELNTNSNLQIQCKSEVQGGAGHTSISGTIHSHKFRIRKIN